MIKLTLFVALGISISLVPLLARAKSYTTETKCSTTPGAPAMRTIKEFKLRVNGFRYHIYPPTVADGNISESLALDGYCLKGTGTGIAPAQCSLPTKAQLSFRDSGCSSPVAFKHGTLWMNFPTNHRWSIIKKIHKALEKKQCVIAKLVQNPTTNEWTASVEIDKSGNECRP